MLPLAAVLLLKRGSEGRLVIELPGQNGQDRTVRFGILGPVRAWRGTQELDLGPGKQRAVLAVLLLNANRPVPTGQIVAAVWGDEPPENGANVVQKYVAGLRRVLEPDRSPRSPGQLLALTDAGYRLRVEPGCLDADMFHAWMRQAQAARAEGALAEAADTLRGALAMWRSEPLAGLSGPVFDTARGRLAESRAAALETWAETELELGHHADVVPELVRLVAELPLREHLRYLLILALYQLGRQAEALAAYREARTFLVEELGIEPGERLRQLHRQILQADPTLAAGPPRAALAAPAPASETVPAEAASPVGHRRRLRPAHLVVILTPLVTIGLASWAVVAYFAARRRSYPLGVAAAGYLALAVLFMYVSNAAPPGEQSMAVETAGFAAFLVSALGGAVHAAVLCYRPNGPATRPEQGRDAGHRPQLTREQARYLATHRPDIARQLSIGRPDLVRGVHDGGLVDLNGVPEHVVAALPGVTPHQARRIVADRAARGRFTSVDDLVARELLPRPVADAVQERLIFVGEADGSDLGVPTPPRPAHHR